MTMLNIELQHFGGRGAASSTAKGKSALKYFKETARQFNEAKISANKVIIKENVFVVSLIKNSRNRTDYDCFDNQKNTNKRRRFTLLTIKY